MSAVATRPGEHPAHVEGSFRNVFFSSFLSTSLFFTRRKFQMNTSIAAVKKMFSGGEGGGGGGGGNGGSGGRCWGMLAILLFGLLACSGGGHACSCLPYHPQMHYCNSDYVLLVKVKGPSKIVESERSQVYQVKVKKAFKTSEKTSLALKHSQDTMKIWSPKDDSMCGATLKPNVKYLIAGKEDGGKAWLYLCDFYEEWNSLTTKQRKGFRLLYKQGCECKIPYCAAKKCNVNANMCVWDPVRERKDDCERQHSICMHQPNGHCDWNKSRVFRECTKRVEKMKREEERIRRKEERRRRLEP